MTIVIPEVEGQTFLWSTGNHLQDYKETQHRIPQLTTYLFDWSEFYSMTYHCIQVLSV
jgi:hypothetical protein